MMDKQTMREAFESWWQKTSGFSFSRQELAWVAFKEGAAFEHEHPRPPIPARHARTVVSSGAVRIVDSWSAGYGRDDVAKPGVRDARWPEGCPGDTID